MSPEKKVKLNESPEINLVWTMIYYRKVSGILKHGTHVGAWSVAFFLNIFPVFFVNCKIISLFFWSGECLWHVIIAHIPICNCTAESEHRETHPKIINILITIYYYVFPCYNVFVCSFSLIIFFFIFHLNHPE